MARTMVHRPQNSKKAPKKAKWPKEAPKKEVVSPQES